jgi:hypothetical protein
MDASVIVAIITSVVSLILGIYTLQNNIRLNKNNIIAQENIKQLDLKNVLIVANFKNKQKIYEKRLDAYKKAISATQEIKDFLRAIIKAPEKSIFSSVALKDINLILLKIEGIYSQEFADFDDPSFHRIKNYAQTCKRHLIKATDQSKFTSEMLPDDLLVLEENWENIANEQNVMRDTRQHLFEEMLNDNMKQ